MSSGDSSDVLAKKTINELKIAELRKELDQRSVDHKGLKLKNQLVEALENVSPLPVPAFVRRNFSLFSECHEIHLNH